MGLDALKEALIALLNLGARKITGAFVTGAEVWDYLKTEGVSIFYSGLINLATSTALVAAKVLVRVIALGLVLMAGESALEAAIPVIGWALKALNVAETGAQLALAAGAALVEGWVTKSELVRLHAVKVQATPFESAYFPPAAATYTVTLSVGSTATFSKSGDLRPVASPDNRQRASLDVFEDVPVAGRLSVTVQLFDRTGRVVGTALATVANSERAGDEQEVELEVEGKALPIEDIKALVHKRRLEPSVGAFEWRVTPNAPVDDHTALRCVPASGVLGVCDLGGISVSQQKGFLAWNFSSPIGSARIISQIGADASLLQSAPTYNATPGADRRTVTWVVHGLGELDCVLMSVDGAPLRAYPFDPRKDSLATFARGATLPKPRGELRGSTLSHCRVHPTAHTLVALTEYGLETVSLDRAEGCVARLHARRGPRAGQLSGPIAVAPFRDLAQVAVLEQAARRVQVFDFYGNPIAAYGGAWLPLSRDPAVRYLDLDVSDKGYAWLLSMTTSGGRTTYGLDIYSPSGVLVKALGGVNAGRFALDRYNTLFALNAENRIGQGGYPIPTLSEWFPA